jgi:hypothetical protein
MEWDGMGRHLTAATWQELKEAARNVSKWAMLRAEVILGLDCIVLVRTLPSPPLHHCPRYTRASNTS